MRYFSLFILLLLVGCNKPQAPLPAHALDISWRFQRSAADFHLTDATRKPRSLADFRGKVVVLLFGYTHCPEVCPITLASLAQLMRQLGPASENVQVLFVTVDPERDTPDVLAQYVPSFYPSFLGLYGDARATAEAAKVFAVGYEKHAEKSGDYSMDHSVGTYLISRTARWCCCRRTASATNC